MEFLKAILGDDLFKSVSDKVGEYNGANPDKPVKIADLSSGDYVSANKFGELETEANGYKTQLETLNAEIGKLKKESSSTNDEISRRLGELQTKYDTDTEALKKTIGDLKFNGALDAAIAAAGAKSAKALKGVIDMDKIKFDDGKLIGFNEQLEGLKKDYGYLFNDSPSSTGMSHGSPSPDTASMSDAEYYSYYYNQKK